MATDIERLTVVLEANIRKYEKEMARTRQVTDNAMRQVERSAQGSMKRLESIMGGVGNKLKAGLAGIFAGISIREVSQLADSYTKVQNALKVTGLEGEKLRSTYAAIYAMSQRQSAPLEAMATLYGRVSSAQKDLNATGPEILRVTEGVAMALKIQGTSAEEASGALLQLGQALSGGKIQAEEYNSLLDGARPVLQAVAAGMVEAGGSVSKLTALVKDGKVSSEAFFRAFLAGMPVIEKQAAAAGTTMSQNMGKAQDALKNLVGALDEALQATNKASGGVNSFVATIDAISAHVPGAMEALGNLQSKMAEIGNSAVFKRISEGLNSVGLIDNNLVKPLNMFDQAFGAKTSAGSMAGYKPPTVAPAVKPIKNSDYKVPGDDDKKSSREKLNDYEREVVAIGKRTRALETERETVGKSAGETAKAEAAFRLLEAAKKANVAVTPELKAQIEQLSAAYGEATQKIEDAREAQDRVAEASREAGQMLSSAFTDAIVEGEKFNDVLKKLLKSLASKGIESVFSSLFSGGSGGTGLIGQLFGFGTGKAVGGPVRPGVAYPVGESGPETFVPTTPGRIIPHGKGGGGVVVNMGSTTINAPSGDPQMIAAMLDQRDRAMVARLPALVRNAQQRGQLGR